MSQKSSTVVAPIQASPDHLPSNQSRLDLLETKLLAAIVTLSAKLDAHITKSSDVIHELSAASTIKFRSHLYPEAKPLSTIPLPQPSIVPEFPTGALRSSSPSTPAIILQVSDVHTSPNLIDLPSVITPLLPVPEVSDTTPPTDSSTIRFHDPLILSAHLVASTASYSLAMFPIMYALHFLNKNLLCSRPLPWPDFLPSLLPIWHPPWP